MMQVLYINFVNRTVITTLRYCNTEKNNQFLTVEFRYRRGTVPGCVNIPFATAFTPEGELSPCVSVQELNSRKNQVKVIVGSRGKHAVNVSRS